MEIGISVFNGMDISSIVENLKKSGVNRTFIKSDAPNFDNVMKLLHENNIICESLHAPYNRINNMWSEDDEAANEILNRLIDSVDKCAKYNIPATVVHVSSGRPMPEINEKGIKRYEYLFNYANERGVIVALENLRYLENLDFLMNKYNTPAFCWDNGHEYCYTKGVKYLDLYANRLCILHIHDNRCGVDTDDHLLPFEGSIDFDEVAKDLAKSGYKGTLMLEIGKNISVDGKKVYETLSDEDYISRAAESAKRLAHMVESYR